MKKIFYIILLITSIIITYFYTVKNLKIKVLEQNKNNLFLQVDGEYYYIDINK